MNKSAQAQTRPPQSHLDKICYQRILSPNFAQKPTFIQRIITTIKGASA
ncbi:hypothetical protein [Acinetobacter qingfengensis]|nr:hypothetical protein [Acinetobacter qingfengensis]